MADGFHIDGDGNLWIGSTSTTFTTSAPFYVETDGTIHAEQGDIGGLDIGSTFIQSTNYSSANSTGYRLQSDGDAVFYGTLTATDLNATGATISGTITASDGTIGGIDINTSDIQSSNYSSATSGFKIDSSGGAEFNGPILSFGKVASGTPSAASTTSIKLGDAVLFSRDEGSAGNHLFSTKPFVVMADGSEDNPSLTIQGLFQKMGFFLVTTQDNINIDTFKLSNGSDDIWSVNTNSDTFTVLGDLSVQGDTLTVNGDSGGSGQYLGKDSNGTLGYHDITGGTVGINAGTGISIDNTNDAISVVFGNNSGTVSQGNHNHNYLSQSDLDAHGNANNPHDNYLQQADHNANNTAHSDFITNADLSNHVTNSNTNFLSAVGHTAMAAGNLGVAHGLDLGNVLNSSSNGGGTHHSHGNIHTHTGTVLTTAGAGNLYSEPHNHPYANSGHGHNYANSGHTHDYAANSHNHAYASAFHNHNNFAASTHGHNAYALNGHGHSSNSPTVNMWMHDDRFLNVNSNTVPGLNVINRLNPVTANFTNGYVQGLKDNSDPGIPHSFTSMDRKTYRITVQDVEQALTDDGIDTSDVAWLIDRLYYADRYLTEETAEKQAHGARGLLNGELEAVLVQAIKDLSAKIDTLEDRIATLEG
jgi:hypothetical protein